MIEINKLQDHNLKMIVALLHKIKVQPFEIAIPKSTKQFFSASEDIAHDYLQGAFAGQELKRNSKEFEYEYVSPVNQFSFEYSIKTNDIDSLAESILKLSYGFGNGSNSDQEDYQNSLAEFEDELKSFEIACPDYVEIYHEFIEAAEEMDGGQD